MQTIAVPHARRRPARRARARGVARRDPLRGRHLQLRPARRHRRCSTTSSLDDPPRRARRAWSGARAPASRRWSTCCCASTSWSRARIRIDGQDIAQRHAGEPARGDRHGDAGHFAAAPLDRRQHPLRPPARDRRARCEAAARKAQAHEFIVGLQDWTRPHGLRRARRRARREALRRPAPARRDRARGAEGRADPGARRGHLGARQRGRARDPGAAARADGRQDGDRDRAPPVDDRAHGPPDRARGRAASSSRARTTSCCASDGHYARLWRHQSGGFLPHDLVATETATELPDEPPVDEMRAGTTPEPSTDDAPVVSRA